VSYRPGNMVFVVFVVLTENNKTKYINLLAPELFFKFLHTLYLKCE
jgi:hypothetical protein